jgi:CxxC motif-containing protein (DUF1111 family)
MHYQDTLRSAVVFLLTAAATYATNAAAQPVDPGVRRAATDNSTPEPLAGLGSDEVTFFEDGLTRFNAIEGVSEATAAQGNGLGPRFNSNQCASCHSQPKWVRVLGKPIVRGR